MLANVVMVEKWKHWSVKSCSSASWSWLQQSVCMDWSWCYSVHLNKMNDHSDFSHHINFTINLLVWTLLSLKVNAAADLSYRWTGLCLCSWHLWNGIRQTIRLAVGYTPSSPQFCFISMWLWIFISKKSIKTIKKSKYFDVVQYFNANTIWCPLEIVIV